MENNEKWYQLLKEANALSNSEIINHGILDRVELHNNNSTWHLHIVLEQLVPFEDLNLSMTRLTKYFHQGAPEITSVLYSYRYQKNHFPAKLLEQYLYKAIEITGEANKWVNVLKKYSHKVDDNAINYFVATADDQKICSDSLKLLKPFFNSFGINEIEMNVSINNMETDYVGMKERELLIRNEQADTRSYEEQQEYVQNQQILHQKKAAKEYRNSQATKLSIEELPQTSMEVQELRQKQGSDMVMFEGVLLTKQIDKRSTWEIFSGIVSNYKDSILVKCFLRPQNERFYKNDLITKMKIQVKGSVQYDTFANDVVVMAREITIIGQDDHEMRIDASKEKRVELHAHTKMSALDSVLDVEDYVKAAKAFGHKALAVTDHANCHVLPEFFELCNKEGIKAIAGVEGYYVDDSSYKIALTYDNIDLHNAKYVVFDFETTGFSINFNEIIEIGAVKIEHGMCVDEFSTFVKPNEAISNVITELTGITNSDVVSAPKIEEVLPKFLSFIDGCVLVAHNASFDTEFLYEAMRRQNKFEKRLPCIDTLQLARAMYSDTLKRFNLKDVAKGLKVEIEEQHRALSDAHTTTNVFMKMLGDLNDKGINNYADINNVTDQAEAFKYIIPSHIQILVKNREGLKNFYKIISDSHTTHFHKEARVLKSVIEKYREGLLIGSGCANGEIFRAAYEGSLERLKMKMAFYDYIEVQPVDCYNQIIEASGNPITSEYIKKTLRLIIDTATSMDKIVVATGDVHQLNPEDVAYRRIYCGVARPGGGLHDLARTKNLPNMYFRTTSEMLQAFDFLPEGTAYDIVVTNTNKISDMTESYDLFPKKLFTPRDDFMAKYGVPSMAKGVEELSMKNAESIYGKPLPKYVDNRLRKELSSIIGNGFSSIYYISHMLVKNSNEHGYVVGSRGSVGSSFVATMMKITEVNPLKPHYVCPSCHFSAFKGIDEESIPPYLNKLLNEYDNGMDLPDQACPVCGSKMMHNGVDIPFETFLGFKGDKTPDIDLNFSGEYQDKAHEFTREIFGMDNAFRAGTIGTVADKTAFGFVKNYLEERNIKARRAEIDRIAKAIVGSKRTTGQHPGGIVVVPDDIEYTDVIPVQYPADDVTSNWRTTHFDYHKFESNLLKLDILGHDDPTVIKRLMDYVHERPLEFPFKTVEEIPLNDSKVISLFSSKEVLNLQGDDIDSSVSGTIGIPEFGTKFVRDMLNDIKPKSVSELIKVSGLAHGPSVWQGNARDLIFAISMTNEPIPFKNVIGCRDDIMLELINYGLEAADAFSIMEHVRKGKGLTTEEKALMSSHDVPDWYQASCQKIEYMFPKAHATAYVMMALRIGWFKVYRPIYYYAAYFSCRASEFDVEIFAAGKNAIRNKINEIREKIAANSATNKEIDLVDELQIALELYLRGYNIRQIDIDKSAAHDFVIAEDGKSLYLPFSALDALGDAAAQSIVDARCEHPFESKKDVERRTKLNKTTYNKLLKLGALDSLPDDDVKVLL